MLIENEYYFLPFQEFDLIDRYIVHKFALNYEVNLFFKRILKNGELHDFKISKINNLNYVKKILKMNNPRDRKSWINDPKYYLKSTKVELEYAAKSEYLWVIEDQNNKMAAEAVFIANPNMNQMTMKEITFLIFQENAYYIYQDGMNLRLLIQ